MSDLEREYLRSPRDADFPTLPIPTDFQTYALAYYLGAKELWEKSNKFQPNQVDQAPMPDNLVYPILFLVHHFLELELKTGIELTYSIGNMKGEIAEDPNQGEVVPRSHDLQSLFSLMKANLAKLDGIPEWSPTESTSQLIEDINKFGVFGESLRYPLATVNPKSKRRAMGTKWPNGLIPDIAAIIEAAEKAREDFGGLTSYLMNCEEILTEERLKQFGPAGAAKHTYEPK